MDNQRVLITAGASGVGREIAIAFAKTGAKVFVCDIDAKGLEALKADIPGVATGICDVSKRDAIEKMVHDAAAALGGIDVLLNNAGISGPTQPVEEFDPDKWEMVLQVNLTGTFNVTRLAIPYLKKSKAGSIITMSSLGGRYGYPDRVAYCTTKWGLVDFTKTLSIELGPFNIRANAIAPGAVEGTRIHNVIQGRADAAHESFDDALKAATSVQSLKRFVDPKDIAAFAVFLASDVGKSISGQLLPIDNDSLKAS